MWNGVATGVSTPHERLPCRALRTFLSWFLVVAAGACVPQPGADGPLPGLAQFEGREIRRIEFAGDPLLPEDSLRAITEIEPTECRVPFFTRSFCPFPYGLDRSYLELDEFARDLVRLQLYYRDHGYYGTRVVPSVDPARNDNVEIRFTIAPGDRVVLRELGIEGTEGIVPPVELRGDLPLEVGGPFRRIGFLSSADTIRMALLRRGYVYADVLRNYSIDITTGVAEARFVAIPGPLVRVDTMVVVGAERLGEETVREALTLDVGDTLRVSELNRSQRNLYAIDLVGFASVEIAPDTMRADSGTVGATVVARVVEAAQYLVDATVGYGTIDCLRTGARWTNRNFLGGGRRLDLSGSLSKIGVGAPLNWGLEDNFLCNELKDAEFSDTLNYRIGADFQQPQLFGTRNRLGIGLHAERISELRIYLRQSVGGQVALIRGFQGALLSTTLEIERGSTRARPVVFCISFDVCAPDDVNRLQRSRWSNSLALGALIDRTSRETFTTRGYQLVGDVAWASPLLGSDDEYLRVLGEAAAYREVRPGWVFAARVLGGTFLNGSLNPRTGFIPPQRRFYAGGPNSVRGFERNALGPRAYVVEEITEEGDTIIESSATGGTEIVAASAELRMPSPVLSRYLRFAAFVDAGQVWAPNTRAITNPIRVTPGAGVRVVTPVGPIRVDIAYNFYSRRPGPLYFAPERDEGDPGNGDLILLDPDYEPERDSLWNRFQIHFAVGQAF